MDITVYLCDVHDGVRNYIHDTLPIHTFLHTQTVRHTPKTLQIDVMIYLALVFGAEHTQQVYVGTAGLCCGSFTFVLPIS